MSETKKCQFCKKDIEFGKKCNCVKSIFNDAKELEKKGLKLCDFCKKEIDIKLKVCNFCGKKQNSQITALFIVIIFICLILFAFYKIFSSLDFSSTQPKTVTSGTCTSEMKKEVSNEYKSPSTVEFITCKWDKDKGIYGEADAQNGFGGVIRTSFLCNGNSCSIIEK